MEEKQSSAIISERIHAVATGLVAVFFALILFRLGTGLSKTELTDWELPLLITLTAASTLTALARQLQWQYVLGAAFIAALVGSMAHTFSVNSGIPFGPFVFGPRRLRPGRRWLALYPHQGRAGRTRHSLAESPRARNRSLGGAGTSKQSHCRRAAHQFMDGKHAFAAYIHQARREFSRRHGSQGLGIRVRSLGPVTSSEQTR